MDTTRKTNVIFSRDSAVVDFGVRKAGSSDPPGAELLVERGARVEFCWKLRKSFAFSNIWRISPFNFSFLVS